MDANTVANYQVYINEAPTQELLRFVDNKYKESNFLRNDRFEELRNDIGEELFSALTDEDKEFILKTDGSIDFGYKITSTNIHDIEKIIREDYEY